jgi:hypothetical protein
MSASGFFFKFFGEAWKSIFSGLGNQFPFKLQTVGRLSSPVVHPISTQLHLGTCRHNPPHTEIYNPF